MVISAISNIVHVLQYQFITPTGKQCDWCGSDRYTADYYNVTHLLTGFENTQQLLEGEG